MSGARTANWNAEKLEKRHERKKFDCGRASLDTYLHRQAGQGARRHVAAPFVVCDDDDQVIGYYTLSALSVDVDGLAEETARQLSKYPEVPAILLGRLAVDRSRQRNDLGCWLLIDALFRADRQAAQIGPRRSSSTRSMIKLPSSINATDLRASGTARKNSSCR